MLRQRKKGWRHLSGSNNHNNDNNRGVKGNPSFFRAAWEKKGFRACREGGKRGYSLAFAFLEVEPLRLNETNNKLA